MGDLIRLGEKFPHKFPPQKRTPEWQTNQEFIALDLTLVRAIFSTKSAQTGLNVKNVRFPDFHVVYNFETRAIGAVDASGKGVFLYGVDAENILDLIPIQDREDFFEILSERQRHEIETKRQEAEGELERKKSELREQFDEMMKQMSFIPGEGKDVSSGEDEIIGLS